MPPKSPVSDPAARVIRFCDRTVEILLYAVFLLVPLVFIIYTRDQFELPKLTLLRMLTALMLGAWGVRTLAAGRLDFRRSPLDLPIAVWLGLQLVTTFWSVSRSVSVLGEYENFRGLLTVANYAVLYFLAVNFLRTRAQIDRLLFVILLSGLGTTAYGISQFFGIDFIAWNPASISQGRYFSSLGNPNFLAAYLAMVMPLVVIFFVETPSRFKRLLLFVCFMAMFFALMGTWSRGGFLGLVGALAVLLFFGLQNVFRFYRAEAERERLTLPQLVGRQAAAHKLWVAVLVLAVGVLVAISATFGRHHMVRVYDSIVHYQETIKVSRLHIWGPAVRIFRDHPLLGTGLDTFKTVFPRYATPAFAAIDGANVASRTAHNEILQVLATQGLVGLIIVGWLTWAILVNWRRAYTARQDSWRDRLILYGLLGTWTAYSIQNLFSFGVAAIDTFYWLVPAIIVLLQATPQEQERAALPQTAAANPAPALAALGRARTPLAVGVAALAAFLAWQAYHNALADYQYNLASVFRMQGLYDQAAASFVRAARMVPWEVKYVVYEGLAYEEKAKSVPDPAEQRRFLELAIAAYRRGIALNPVNAYYLGNLGRAYGLAADLMPDRPENYAQAVEYYRRAIDQAPVTVLFYQNLGLLYLLHGQEAELQRLQDRMAGFDPAESARLAFTAANQYYTRGDLARAETVYRQALKLNPKYVEAYFNLGVTLAQRGAVTDAAALWRRALELKPDFEPARQMLDRYAVRASGAQSGGDILQPGR